MSTYSTYGHLFGKMPYIPIIKVKNWDIKIPENVYTTGDSSSDTTNNTVDARKQLFTELAPWYKLFSYTWTRLQASDAQTVSNEDLAFLLDLAWNLSTYYPENKVLYFTIDARTAFRFEVTEFIILGYSPADAQKKALDSVKAEKFVSKEPLLVKVTNMSAEEKKKLNEVAGQNTYSEAGDKGEEEPVKEPEPKSSKLWIIAGVLILILTAK